MTPTLKAMVEAMLEECRRQSEMEGVEGVQEGAGQGLWIIDGNIDLEKVARAGLEAAWRPASELPERPTDDTWRIIAYCPGARTEVRELYRHQDYEGGPWNWATPPGVSGRGYLVLVEAISRWQSLPEPPYSTPS